MNKKKSVKNIEDALACVTEEVDVVEYRKSLLSALKKVGKFILSKEGSYFKDYKNKPVKTAEEILEYIRKEIARNNKEISTDRFSQGDFFMAYSKGIEDALRYSKNFILGEGES